MCDDVEYPVAFIFFLFFQETKTRLLTCMHFVRPFAAHRAPFFLLSTLHSFPTFNLPHQQWSPRRRTSATTTWIPSAPESLSSGTVSPAYVHLFNPFFT